MGSNLGEVSTPFLCLPKNPQDEKKMQVLLVWISHFTH